MRLWHKDLVPVLPRQQLLGQWRECCAIMGNIAKKGTPNHVLVNSILDYPYCDMYAYCMLVRSEFANRGYRINFEKIEALFKEQTALQYGVRAGRPIFDGWMNDRYLTQNYYNLQEKYDCGAISDEEWRKIEERYEELMGAIGNVPEKA